ncbi:MAG TPA: Smr/MutS family protein [Thermoanaerobaculia bacterium]|nr:Smr/MutS family protein [Thermoanaerobaculia bacterium]
MDPYKKSVELDRVLELISLETKTGPGRLALSRREVETSWEECERLQSELAEMVRFYTSEGLLPLAGLREVGPLLRGEEALDLEQCWEVVRAVRACQSLRETFVRVDIYPRLRTIAEQIPEHKELLQTVGRFFTHEGKLREDASAELRSIRSRIQSKRNAIQRTLGDLMSRHSDALQDPIITVRSDRYVIPVRAERRNEVPGILHERSGSGASFFIEPLSIVEANNDLAQLMIEEREEIARITRFIAGHLINVADSIIDGVTAAGELDAIQACAVIHRIVGATRPAFSRTKELAIIEGRHPLLDERLAEMRRSAFGESDQTSVVPTTIRINRDKPVLVISGPNAGGKTVALKSAGLLVAMACAGLPVPASEGTIIPIFDRLFVLIGDDQNVMEHLSTFSAYLLRLRRILESASDKSLVLLDELGSGTDPEEGAAIAAAVLEELTERGCLTVITTHVLALKTVAMNETRIGNASMEFDAASGQPTFRLVLGIPGRSRAIEAAARVGLPQRVIDSARQRLGDRYGDMDRLLADLQETSFALTRERDSVRQLEVELRKRTDALAEEKSLLEAERQKLSRSLRDKLDQAKQEVTERFQAEVRRMRELDEKDRSKAKTPASLSAILAPMDNIDRSLDAVPSRDPRVGDRVQHRKFKIIGQLVALSGSRASISVNGRKMDVDLSELLLQESPAKAAPSKAKPAAAAKGDSEDETISAELNLIGQRVMEALDESDKFLDRSMMEGRRAVRLIHGFGTGTLRKAIREHLRKHPAVRSFRAADENEGGDGATVAVLDV